MAADITSRGAPVASNSEPSFIDRSAVEKILSKKDSVVGKIKVKKPLLKKPEKGDALGRNLDGTTRSASPDSPLINEIDLDLRATFQTGRPMEDRTDMIVCKHCKKALLTSVAASHIKGCLQKKQDRAQKKKEAKEAARKAKEAREKGEDRDGDLPESAANRNGDGDADSLPSGSQQPSNAKKAMPSTNEKGKKRKADTEADKEPKKKKTKKEIEAAKPKVPKPKGPVDVEKQCGVAIANGAFCARSLTCKSHSMGAKRAVPGRSLPYDMLLAAYQKKNQAKQQKAAIDANAPLPDDLHDPSAPVDSDEETDLVMAGVARSCPRPLAQHIFIPARKKYAFVRVHGMLSKALGIKHGGMNLGYGSGLFGVAGSAAVDGDDVERRASVASSVMRTGGAGGPPSRKPSLVAVSS
ncbi:hypothetical protein MMC14_009021 [Varicellaria rhodocarpa]|nr:hypothetical protein [Varicellaria rhodocarpa]